VLDASELASPRVLVVEDEAYIADMLLRFLQRSGMSAAIARTGADALRQMPQFRPHVVLLDLQLPDTNGVSLIPALAQQGNCGIIVLSGNGDEAERVVGIELGADDYIVKPPPLRELVARIRAVHRRVARAQPVSAAPEQASGTIRFEDLEVDLRRHLVIWDDGEKTPLTGAESKALEMLIAARGQPLSRDELCRAALRRPLGAEDRAVDQLIVGLRKKLSVQGKLAPVIVSVRGAGYALSP